MKLDYAEIMIAISDLDWARASKIVSRIFGLDMDQISSEYSIEYYISKSAADSYYMGIHVGPNSYYWSSDSDNRMRIHTAEFPWVGSSKVAVISIVIPDRE